MNMVYIVTSGEYSEYSIDGVFSTRDKAEEFIKLRSRYSSVEEWPLDAFDELIKSGRYVYFVLFDEAGNVKNIPLRRDTESELMNPEVEETTNYRNPLEKFLRVSVWARDDEHAIKVAAEKRAQYLAERAGVA